MLNILKNHSRQRSIWNKQHNFKILSFYTRIMQFLIRYLSQGVEFDNTTIYTNNNKMAANIFLAGRLF